MIVIARTDPHAALRGRATTRIPDWIAVDADGQASAGTGRRPRLWVTCALGPYNFEFMTEVHAGDRRRCTRWTASSSTAGRLGHVLLRALPAELPDGHRASTCRARDDPAGPRAARLHRLARSSGSSSCGSCGTARSARSIPTARFIPNTGGGATSGLDMKTIGELAPTLFADRQARRGADAAVGQRQERQGVPRHDGAQADRRHLQRRRRGAVPLEGLGAERGRRSGSGSPTASPTGCGRGSPSSPGRSTTSAG